MVVLLTACGSEAEERPAVTVELSFKTPPDLGRVRGRLPRVSGGAVWTDWEPDDASVRTKNLLLTREGVRHDGRVLGGDEALRVLASWADVWRDREDEWAPSRTRLALFVDRDLPLSELKPALLAATHLEVRFRHLIVPVHPAAAEDGAPDFAYPQLRLSVDDVWSGQRVRLPEPVAVLELREAEEASDAEDLGAALSRLSPRPYEDGGVRMVCAPGVRAERLLRVLVTVAAAFDEPVPILDLRDSALPGARSGAVLDGRPVRLGDDPVAAPRQVRLRVYRDPR